MKNTKQNIKITKNKEIILERQTEVIARKLLKKLGMKIDYLGFNYWQLAIVIYFEMERNNEGRLKMMDLYGVIAKRYKTTASKVEKAMRYAKNSLNLEKLQIFFGISCKINNKTLLLLLKDSIVENRNINSIIP